MNKTVLIVDDSMFMRTWLRKILVDNSYRVFIEASDGAEAIIKYKEFSPDIVLLDITMPKVNGLQVLKEIQKYNPSAKVIVCSAMGQQSLIIDALKYGAKDFIVKPYFDKLIPALERMV